MSRASLYRDLLTKKIKPVVYIGLAEIDEPWMLPAVTRFGGWNQCPPPAVHCAATRYWQKRFGAEFCSVCFDTVELVVKTPPETREAATELAWQLFWYRCDIIESGPYRLLGLAAELLNSNYWYWWWD